MSRLSDELNERRRINTKMAREYMDCPTCSALASENCKDIRNASPMKGIHPMRLGSLYVELSDIRAKERDREYQLAWQRECPKCGVAPGVNCLDLRYPKDMIHKYHPHEERQEIVNS
jgi:hypothetical protein